MLYYMTGGIRCEKASAYLIKNKGIDRENIFQVSTALTITIYTCDKHSLLIIAHIPYHVYTYMFIVSN